MYQWLAGLREQRADQLSEREHITGRWRGSTLELDLWTDVVEIWLQHLWLLRRPRHSASLKHATTITVTMRHLYCVGGTLLNQSVNQSSGLSRRPLHRVERRNRYRSVLKITAVSRESSPRQFYHSDWQAIQPVPNAPRKSFDILALYKSDYYYYYY